MKGLCYVILNAPYERKRSTQILKLKTAYDEECTVVEHHKGKGQFEKYYSVHSPVKIIVENSKSVQDLI